MQFGSLILTTGLMLVTATSYLARNIGKVDTKVDGLQRELDNLNGRMTEIERRQWDDHHKSE